MRRAAGGSKSPRNGSPTYRRTSPRSKGSLAIIQDLTSNSTNTVIYELMVAARTDEKLRATLRR